jgi:hypothetical protein
MKEKILEAINEIIDKDSTTRSPFLRLAEMYLSEAKYEQVLTWAAAAMQIKPTEDIDEDNLDYQDTPHRLMYEALYGLAEYNASKRHFDQCFAYQPFNTKYLTDYRRYYELPYLCFIKAPASVDINYPTEKIVVEQTGADWMVYIPEGYTLPADGIMTGYKQALDNSKYFMAFTNGITEEPQAFMIYTKMVQKVDNFSEILAQENAAQLIWEEMKKFSQAMICGRARIISNNK